MRRTLFLFILFLSLQASAQMSKTMDMYPHYTDFSIPKPEGKSVMISMSDLKLTNRFLDQYPDGTPTLSREGLQRMYDFYRNDFGGKKEWDSMVEQTYRLVSNWDIKSSSIFGGSNRYVFALSQLKSLATVYMYTGCEPVSLFIRGHLAKMASLPLDFWVHAELRGLDLKHPKGALETAEINGMLGFALAACKKDMTPKEIKTIETAWYERGHRTAFNWLDNFRPNNWTAAIATGLLYSAKYFNDSEARQRALDALTYFANTTIGPDGSYGEGNTYFSFPASELVKAALVMTPEEIEKAYGSSNIRHSMEWKIYGMLLNVPEDGTPGTLRISYGDNPFADRSLANTKFTMFADVAYQDGFAAWVRNRWNGRMSSDEVIIRSKFPNRDATRETSPMDANLPLLKVFDSGDCYFHSSWEDNAIVFGLKAGDHGGRVKHSHCRPELNSIALGAFGEYIIVTCGSASYRSRLYNEHDLCSPAFNTISIDGMNQKSYRKPAVKEGRWDNSAVWVMGEPHAIVTRSECDEDGNMFLKSDASDAYHIAMKEASRSVRFVPEGGFFIIRDIMTPEDSDTHRYDYRFNINNRDGKAHIIGKAESLKVERGGADLYIAVACNSKMNLAKNPGYLHSPYGRDYDEGGPLTGKPGSAIELDWSTNCNALDVTAVLLPRAAGSKAPSIKISGGKVIVNGKSYDIPE